MPPDPPDDPYALGPFLSELNVAVVGEIEWPNVPRETGNYVLDERLRSALTDQDRRERWPDEDFDPAGYKIEWLYYDGFWPLVVRRDPISRLADLGRSLA